MIHHINYEIDKEKYRNMFYENIQDGQWHHSVPHYYKDLFWYQLFIPDKLYWPNMFAEKGARPHGGHLKPLIELVERDLNIHGMNNFPRFSYQFPNSRLVHHVDEDNMMSININLFDTTPIIHIEHKPYPYQCAFIDVGHIEHGVEPDPNPRLILKFALLHSYDEVYERLDKVGLL